MKEILKRLFVKAAAVKSMTQQAVIGVSLLATANFAHAQSLGRLAGGWKNEASAIVPVILFIIAGLGIIAAGCGVISGILAKKNNQPLSWQVGAVIGGSLAVIIPVIVLAMAGTLGGGDGNAAGMMNEMNINY